MTDGASPPHAAAHALDVSRRYVGGDGTPIQVLENLDLEVLPGESIAVIGQSGVGKSTLLHLLGGLDAPTTGEVRMAGFDLSRLSTEALARLRNERIGFVFQFHHLLREFTAVENVMMPRLIAGVAPRTAREEAAEILGRVGLERRLEHKPAQLSGGEQQRVAVARALVARPVLLLADEPSGNLDPPTGERLHDLLFQVGRESGAAMVLVTHNLDLASRADRVLRLKEGRLVSAGEEREELPTESWGR